MSLPINSKTIIVPLADTLFIDGAWRSELRFVFNLGDNRLYSGSGQTMQTGLYDATITPSPVVYWLEFAITLNEDTEFQQEIIDSLARAYAQLYATGLCNTEYGTDYPGLQWPLNERVVENLTLVLATFRPHGMGGAFRVYDPSLYATISEIIEPFWVNPYIHRDIWIEGLVYVDPGSSAEQALLDLGNTLYQGDDVVYAQFLSLLSGLPGIVQVDEFFIDEVNPPIGTSDIIMGSLDWAAFDLSRIDIQQTPITLVEIWITGFVYPDPGAIAEQALKDLGDTLILAQDVIYNTFRNELAAVPGIDAVDEFNLDTVNPPTGQVDIPIAVNHISDFALVRIDIQETPIEDVEIWMEGLVYPDPGSSAEQALFDLAVSWMLDRDDDVPYAPLLAELAAVPGISTVDDFFIGITASPTGTSDILISNAQRPTFSLARINIGESPPEDILIWIEATVYVKILSAAEDAIYDYGQTLGEGDDVIDATIRADLIAIPDVEYVFDLRIDIVNPPVLTGDYPIAVREVPRIDYPRIKVFNGYFIWIAAGYNAPYPTGAETEMANFCNSNFGPGDPITWEPIYAHMETVYPGKFLNNSSAWSLSASGWTDLVPPLTHTIPLGPNDDSFFEASKINLIDW